MKKQLLLFIIIGLFVLPIKLSYGQIKDATDSSKATNGASLDKDTQVFKDKIVNAVTEQYKKDRKAVSGFVTNTKTLTFKTDTEEEYQVKIDDVLTKFFQVIGATKKEIKQSQIEKGDYIIVTGPVVDKTINANFVYMDDKYLVKNGKITEIDKEAYSIKVTTAEKDNFTLDVETSTKQQILNIKTLEVEKVGFSKIKEGDTIHFVVIKTGQEKEANRFPAEKILIIPQEYFIK